MRFVACLAIGSIFAGAALAESPKITDDLIRGVERRYNQARTLQVEFAETFTAAGRKHRPEVGQLVLKKPGQMRWTYSDPAGKLFISDGQKVYLYTAPDNRVEVSKLKASEDMRAPLAFLLGKMDLRKEFRSFEINPGDGGTYLVAEAKSERVPYERVRMLIGPSFEIQQLTVDGRDGSVLSFTFRNEQLNLPVPSVAFHFTPPAGADVVDAVAAATEDN